MKNIISLILFLLLPGICPAAVENDYYLGLLIRGDNLYYAANYDSALVLYDSASIIRPQETAPLTGLYNSAFKAQKYSLMPKTAAKLYSLDSSSVNMERLIYSNALNGNWFTVKKWLNSGQIDYNYGCDLAGQAYYLGGYLLECLRISEKGLQKNSGNSLLANRRETVQLEFSGLKPLLKINNSSAVINYNRHPVLTDGWYNGFDLEFNLPAHSLNFNWSEQRFQAKELLLPGGYTTGSINKLLVTQYTVPFTGWISSDSTSSDSTYHLDEPRIPVTIAPLQREFYFDYRYHFFTALTGGVSYKYSKAEDDFWSEGHTGGLMLRMAEKKWFADISANYGIYKMNRFENGFNRTDSLYLYQDIWDTAYQNSDGNYEKDSLFYTYTNKYAVYRPYSHTSSLKEGVLQFNVSGGYELYGWNLGLAGSVRRIGSHRDWDWQYKTNLGYTYRGITLWGAYSHGGQYLFNSADGKVLYAIKQLLKNGYETGISWQISRGWQLEGYYGYKKYSGYQQTMYLAGVSYSLFRHD